MNKEEDLDGADRSRGRTLTFLNAFFVESYR